VSLDAAFLLGGESQLECGQLARLLLGFEPLLLGLLGVLPLCRLQVEPLVQVGDPALEDLAHGHYPGYGVAQATHCDASLFV